MAWGWIDDVEWRAVLRQLNRIEYSLKTLTQEGRHEMATLQEVMVEVERAVGLSASISAYVNGQKAENEATIAALKAEIEVLKAAGADPSALQAIVEKLDAANDALDGLLPAVVANPE